MNYLINFIGMMILCWAVYKLLQGLFPNIFKKNDIQSRLQRTQQTAKKNDADRIAERIVIPREDKLGVNINWYRYPSEEKTPTVFLCHGGTLMDGDADQMDTFCDRMKSLWRVNIVSINYTKINEQKIPYQQEEIVDTVRYFVEHKEQYNIDVPHMTMVGFSGGAYIMNGACALLKNFGIEIKGMIEFYPLIDDTLIRLTDANLLNCPIKLVTCNNEEMNKRCALWYEHLEKVNSDSEIIAYPDAIQGFIEYNNPEFSENPMFKNNMALFDEDQENMARACEIRIKGILDVWNEVE